MNSRLTSSSVLHAALLLAALNLVPVAGTAASPGEVDAAAATARGTSTIKFEYGSDQMPAAGAAAATAANQSGEFDLVPLPLWCEPRNIGHNGVVLLVDWNIGSFVYWRNGTVVPTTNGKISGLNRNGEMLREITPGEFALEQADGALMPVKIDGGSEETTYLENYSSHFACGFTNRLGPTLWDFRGGSQRLFNYDSFLVYTDAVNDHGLVMAEVFGWDPTGLQKLEGTQIGNDFLPGLSGVELSNTGAAILYRWDDLLGPVGPPVFWKGTQHPIGSEDGIPLSLNDHDEVIGQLADGRLMLWRNTGSPGAPVFVATDLRAATGLDIERVVQINNAGTILVSTWNPAGEYQPYLLVPRREPARLGVDFDRNGAIDPSASENNPDLLLVRRNLPYFFWVNDDDDSGETAGDDIPGEGHNREDGQVNGTRDLVDFFPVHLNISPLLQEFPATAPGITYKLAQAGAAANFLVTDLQPATAGSYHSDPEKAKSLSGKPVTRIPAEGVPLDPVFLGKILSDNQGIILVEAIKETTQPLRLEVWREAERVALVELPLRFAGVESMFRHKNIVNAVEVQPATTDRPGAPNWPDELNNRQAFVFVHGYNVNQKQARGWHAEFFKRLWWSGSNAQFWGVTWYGTDSQKVIVSKRFTPNYQANVTHAFGCAPYLANFLNDLKTTGGFTVINVAGHSLGNLVVSSAISDHDAPVRRYFMLDAAVAAEAYDGAVTGDKVLQDENDTASMPHSDWNKELGGVYPSRLWATNWHALFGSPDTDKRAALTWRNRFQLRANVDYFDFYSSGEEVLDYTSDKTPSVLGLLLRIGINSVAEYLHFVEPEKLHQPIGHRTWQLQEQLKGRNITDKFGGSNYGGWGFNTLLLRKNASGAGGKGPIMLPSVLRPTELNDELMTNVFTPEALREEPFFRPGSNRKKVGSWVYDVNLKTNSWQEDRLKSLYDKTTGSAFAGKHRDTLLARMIPAMSPAAGRIAVPKLTPQGSQVTHNYDMNTDAIRRNDGSQGIPLWPKSRADDFRWWHSDLREVAYPYVIGFYDKVVALGDLGKSTP